MEEIVSNIQNEDNDNTVFISTNNLSNKANKKQHPSLIKRNPKTFGFLFMKKYKANLVSSDLSKQIIILFFFLLFLIYIFHLYKYFLLPLFILMIIWVFTQLPCFIALLSIIKKQIKESKKEGLKTKIKSSSDISV